jgi:hypothetical protein
MGSVCSTQGNMQYASIIVESQKKDHSEDLM